MYIRQVFNQFKKISLRHRKKL